MVHWKYEFVYGGHDYDSHYAVAKCSNCGHYFSDKHENGFGQDKNGKTVLFKAFFTNYKGHEEQAQAFIIGTAKQNCPPRTLWRFCPECGEEFSRE